jgi:hypothetical protein
MPIGRNGGSLFAADPQAAFDKQSIFWAPEALSTVLSLRATTAAAHFGPYKFEVTGVAGGEFRRASDGWHAIVPLGGARHRLWLPELPAEGSRLAVELALDSNFDIRLRTAHRFRSALENRPLGPPALWMTAQQRQRMIDSARAVDGWLEGHSYREIADVLFRTRRSSRRSWKTDDLRSRTIRLVQNGLALMRGGYRALLRARQRGR